VNNEKEIASFDSFDVTQTFGGSRPYAQKKPINTIYQRKREEARGKIYRVLLPLMEFLVSVARIVYNYITIR